MYRAGATCLANRVVDEVRICTANVRRGANLHTWDSEIIARVNGPLAWWGGLRESSQHEFRVVGFVRGVGHAADDRPCAFRIFDPSSQIEQCHGTACSRVLRIPILRTLHDEIRARQQTKAG